MGDKLTRRDVVVRAAWLGAGAVLATGGRLNALLGQAGQRVDESSSRMGWPSVSPLPPVDNHYPLMPTWKTDLRQLAPNVYVYQQQGGTGLPNAGISNAGLFVGEDWSVASTRSGFRCRAKRFLPPPRRLQAGSPSLSSLTRITTVTT